MTVNQVNPPFLPMRVHSTIDDMGMTPAQFRVYGHFCRRANDPTGTVYAAVPNIAAACKMDARTVRKSISYLAEKKLLTGQPRNGDTTVYKLTPIDSEGLHPMTLEHAPTTDTATRPPLTFHPPSTDITTCPPLTKRTRQRSTPKDSTEGLPFKDIAVPFVFPSHLQSAGFQAIWAEYVEYNRERVPTSKIKNRPKTLQRQINLLAPFTESEASQALTECMAKEWQAPSPKKQNGYAAKPRLVADHTKPFFTTTN